MQELLKSQWRHVDDVLAAFVPDFGREQSEAERGELIKAVVQALTVLHGRAAGTVQAWQGAHRHELERRRNQEKYRGLLRTVVRAWREEADGRKAKTLRSAALRPGVERGAHPARMDTDTLSTMCSSQRVSGRGAGEELQQDLRKELLRRERKCESGSGVLPVARSAVPAGTRAREDEGVDEGVDAAGEQGEARRRGAPLAGMANSSPVETPSGSPATSCGRV